MDTEKTVVVFRKFKDDGDIVALFPYDEYKNGDCLAFGSFLGFFEMSYTGVMKITKKVPKKEYSFMKKALEQRGYNLAVREKKGKPLST